MADVLAVRDEYRVQTWAVLIQECKASGMTNKEFCEQRSISDKSFYYWQRKFREQLVALRIKATLLFSNISKFICISLPHHEAPGRRLIKKSLEPQRVFGFYNSMKTRI